MSERDAHAKQIVAPRASVSAVIPCFRCGGTIRRAVTSVVRQSLVPAELILIDDASGDGTLGVLLDLQREFGRHWVKVVALDINCGPASARNAGWNAASGEYIAFLDADDTWHPRKLEIQYAFMQAHPEIALSGHTHERMAGSEPLDRPLGKPGYRFVSKTQLLLSNRFITPAVMVRRNIPQRFLESARHMEDHLLWLEIISTGAKVARLNEPLAFVYKGPFGESGLSANMIEMERAELRNYRLLGKKGAIGVATMLFLCGYSLAKFARRMAIVRFGP